MARELRCDLKHFTAATLAATGSCLFYGVVLASRSANSSLIVYDHGKVTAAPLNRVKLRVYSNSASSTVSAMPPVAVQMDNGLFVSMSAKTIATVFFSARK